MIPVPAFSADQIGNPNFSPQITASLVLEQSIRVALEAPEVTDELMARVQDRVFGFASANTVDPTFLVETVGRVGKAVQLFMEQGQNPLQERWLSSKELIECTEVTFGIGSTSINGAEREQIIAAAPGYLNLRPSVGE